MVPEESGAPTIYSGLKAQSDFHLQFNHISNRLLSSSVSAEEALKFNEALDAWSKTLPRYFQLDQDVASFEQWYLFARSRLWWRFWNLKIILFRQLVLKRAIERSQGTSSTYFPQQDYCRDAGVEAAHASIVSIHSFLSHNVCTRLVSWYSVFVCSSLTYGRELQLSRL